MHAYYAKNRDKLHKMVGKFMELIKGELEQISGRPYEDMLKEIWDVYEKDMMERFPYIGGDEASGTKNLTGAYVFVAMGEVLKKYGASMEQIGHLMVLTYERNTLKMPRLVRKLMGKVFSSPKTLNKMFLKRNVKSAENAAKNPGSFETEVQIPPEKGYDFSYHNTVCPLANFAKQYGYEEYMPYVCNLEYVMFGLLGVPLFREKTCFEDGDYCDFKLKLGVKPMDYWPPVFSQGKGYK